MIDCLIFSCGRPLQLDGLLCSIERYAPGLFDSVTVLYLPTSPLYQLAYLDVFRDHDWVAPWRQGPLFEDDVREWLGGCEDLVSFLVDDDLFIRKAPYTPAGCLVLDEILCYSLRLYCDAPRVAPCTWRWQNADSDYGYPFALDGHIYRQTDVDYLLSGFSFDDPTRLEAGGASRVEVWQARYLMVGGAEQCLVGVPANRVSPSSGMPYMRGYDPSWLLDRYQAGVRLDVKAMAAEAGRREPAAHMDIPLVFKEADTSPLESAATGSKG